MRNVWKKDDERIYIRQEEDCRETAVAETEFLY